MPLGQKINFSVAAALLLTLAALGGCQEQPHDTGLTGQHVANASDALVMYLLSRPEVNDSPTRITIACAGVESDIPLDYNVILDRARVELAQQASDRIALIEDKARFHRLQGQELDNPADGGPSIQPQYALYGKVGYLPNRATSYYLCTFYLVDLHTGRSIPAGMFEITTLN